MILVVDNYGTFLGKESERFKLTTAGKKEEYAASNLKQIILIKASGISIGAINLAMQNSVDTVYLERGGKPSARQKTTHF